MESTPDHSRTPLVDNLELQSTDDDPNDVSIGDQRSHTDDVEQLLHQALHDDGGTLNEHCPQVNIGVAQTRQTLSSSFNYDELNEDNTLLFASEWNLTTDYFDDPDDDEEVLVVSTPNTASGQRNYTEENQTERPQSKAVWLPTSSQDDDRVMLLPPMISPEDDDTLVVDEECSEEFSHHFEASLHQLEPVKINGSKLDFQELENYDSEGEDDDEEVDEEEHKKRVEEEEAEASRRYLTINSAPVYRWSEGMLPTAANAESASSGLNVPRSLRTSTLQHQKRIMHRDSTEEDRVSGDESGTFLGRPHQSASYLDNHEDEKKMYMESVKNGPSIPAIGELTGRLAQAQPGSLKSPWIVERLKHLAKAYNDRTTFVKKAIDNIEESGADDSSDADSDADSHASGRPREHFTFESIFGDELRSQQCDQVEKRIEEIRVRRSRSDQPGWIHQAITEFIVGWVRLWGTVTALFEPQSTTYVAWLGVLTMAFCYNAIIIFFRALFPYELESGTVIFFTLDCIADAIYFIDIVWFKPHLKYIKQGQWIDDPSQCRRHYYGGWQFVNDVVATFPVDLCLWAHWGHYNHRPSLQRLSRLNRLLRVDAFWEFFSRLDSLTTKNTYLFRIVHTLCYKMYIIHLSACAYYMGSMYEGFGTTDWTYDNVGNPYLRCFYFAFRVTTSIGGRLPKPSTMFERIYMTGAWLLGVFVFAMVIGQIRDTVANASREQSYYHEVLNKTSDYMRQLQAPLYVQNRVRFWLNFTWDLQKTFNESDILRVLPLKSRTDIALSVHCQTLARVELFKNIDRSVLRDLVLKLQPILFLPNDYICRKGDVGHEMYIVNKGQIQVLGADGTVLISLGEGCVFGEIAILNLEGFTRRTADVRSVGYSQLFALTKSDLWETLKNYPEYQTVLKRKVQRILRKKRKQQTKSMKEALKRRSNRRRSPRSMQQKPDKQHTVDLDEAGDELNPPQTKPVVTDCHVQIVPEPVIPTVEVMQYDDVATDELQFNYDDHRNVDADNEADDDDDEEGDGDVFGRVVGSRVDVEAIVKDRPRTPKLFDAVMETIRPDSKVKGYFSRSQSISSSHYHSQSQSIDDDHLLHPLPPTTTVVPPNPEEVTIKVEDSS